MFLITYSAPDKAVAAVEIQIRTSVIIFAAPASKNGFKSAVAAMIATICETVLILPDMLAAITVPITKSIKIEID